MPATKKKPFKMPKYAFDEYYEVDQGEFGVIEGKGNNRIVEWHHCREEFQDYYPKLNRMLYYGKRKENANVKAFVKKIEQIIKLPRKKRIKWRETTKKHVIYLSLGDFWKGLVHRSLLTILLRAGHYYDRKKDNWKEVIKQDNYLSLTPAAIERFLDGYTRPRLSFDCYRDNGHFMGWVDEFQHLTANEVKKKLVK